MRVTLAQLDPVVGDLLANGRMILDAVRRAAADDADLLVTGELSIIGYPPRDLLVRGDVIDACERAAAEVAAEAARLAPGLVLLLGHPRRTNGGVRGVRNAVTAWRGGRRIAVVDKRLLPGYDVFDEDRWFDPAPGAQPPVPVAGRPVGVVLCEDLWRSVDAGDTAHYAADPVQDVIGRGAELLVAMNASPFVAGKERRHAELLAETARRGPLPLVSVNQTGANDDLVFDGRSRVLDADGRPIRTLPAFAAAVETVSVPIGGTSAGARAGAGDGARAGAGEGAADRRSGARAAVAAGADAEAEGEPIDEVVDALACGIASYVRKTGHRAVVLGLSGGIDSAVVAALAVVALGPGAVHGLLMPSRYSSEGSITDAEALAASLDIGTTRVPILDAHEAVRGALAPALGETLDGLPDENVQARLRGLMLMTWSNARGGLLLATSNKSELAVGYSTLYGDMCGALAPIGDLLKGEVSAVARRLNADPARFGLARPPIPESTITKPPSAELRPDQRDEDSLPPYAVLDRLVDAWVGRDAGAERTAEAAGPADGAGRGAGEGAGRGAGGGVGGDGGGGRAGGGHPGLDAAAAADWTAAIDRNEYKRFQGPVILKVSRRAFGPGRPMPIAMRWRPVAAGGLAESGVSGASGEPGESGGAAPAADGVADVSGAAAR